MTEQTNETAIMELMRLKKIPEGRISTILLLLGIIIATLSIDYNNTTYAYIGTTLIFYGGILSYSRPNKFIRKDLLTSSLYGDEIGYMEIMYKLGYVGTPYLFSPKTMWGLNNVLMIVPEKENTKVNNDLIEEKKTLSMNQDFLQLTPIGHGLLHLYEKELKINFASVELNTLENTLEKIFVNGLQICKEVKISIENDIIIEVQKTIFDETYALEKDHNNILFVDPFTSSIGCILSKITGEQIYLKEVEIVSKNSRKIGFKIGK